MPMGSGRPRGRGSMKRPGRPKPSGKSLETDSKGKLAEKTEETPEGKDLATDLSTVPNEELFKAYFDEVSCDLRKAGKNKRARSSNMGWAKLDDGDDGLGFFDSDEINDEILP